MARERVDVLVVGGGPAGMVTGCLLAQAGLKTLVLERGETFDREFRGEILQPRFHAAVRQAGLYEAIAAWPHEEVEGAHVYFRGRRIGALNLRRLDPRNGTTWWMTQPNLLGALHQHGRKSPQFELRFGADVRALEGTTATVSLPGGMHEIEARVVVAADGRFSTVRRLVGFEMAYDHHDLDVVWFLLQRPENYEHTFGFFLTLAHNYLILPKHPNQLQCGIVMKPGEFAEMHRRPLSELKAELKAAHPVFAEFAGAVDSYTAFRPLKGSTAQVKEWARDGLVLIGDAAHTCSPAGGIGVAVAVETAVVAARVIERCFATGDFSRAALGEIQSLRQKEVNRVHEIQHRGGSAFIGGAPLFRLAGFALFSVLSRTGLLPVLAREMLTGRPLPHPRG